MKTPLALAALALAFAAPLSAQHDLPGRALQFDGFDAVVHVPHSSSMDLIEEITLEAWVRPFGADGGIAGMWGTGPLPDKAQLYLSGGAVHARIARDGIPVPTDVAGPVLPNNEWAHVALTFDGTDLSLYVHGVLAAQVPAPGKLPSANLDLRLGVHDLFFPAPPVFLLGEIDEVRMWRNARDAAQIRRYHNQTVERDAPGLVGSWRFDEPVGENAVKDASTMTNDGFLGTSMAFAADDPARVTSAAAMRWDNLGHGLAGDSGRPLLAGGGSLLSGSMVSLELTRARPATTAALVIGLNTLYANFKGGTMVPTLDSITFGLPTGPVGELDLVFVWGALPPAFDLYFQYWIQDDSGPVGYTASNGLWAEMP